MPPPLLCMCMMQQAVCVNKCILLAVVNEKGLSAWKHLSDANFNFRLYHNK